MLVLSERSGQVYEVDVLAGCSCPYWQATRRTCKHMRALSEYYKRRIEAQKEGKAA